MFTTGAKLLLGATVASLAGTVAYGVLAEGTMGTIGLVSATVALATLAGIVIFTRDANVFADEPDTFDGAAANAARPGASMWPFALGLAVTTMTRLVAASKFSNAALRRWTQSPPLQTIAAGAGFSESPWMPAVMFRQLPSGCTPVVVVASSPSTLR